MRVGMNPSRGKFTSYEPARVTIAVLVYIPHGTGYFEHRMKVLDACLASIQANTQVPYDLLVFNNGSSPEVRAYLERRQLDGAIQYLLHSQKNIGKIGAFQILFRAAPGEIIAYADDDIYFFPGWLREHLKILDAFPKVGMVSGCAVWGLFNDERISSNISFAEGHPEAKMERGRFINDEWMQDWAESYGRDFETYKAETVDAEEIILEYHGVKTFAMANHNQFVIPKAVISQCLPTDWTGRLMGLMDELDISVNEAGYLRLSTFDRTTQHLGNALSPEFIRRFAIPVELSERIPAKNRDGSSAGRIWRKFIMSRPVRWLLLGIYSRLFKLLNPE